MEHPQYQSNDSPQYGATEPGAICWWDIMSDTYWQFPLPQKKSDEPDSLCFTDTQPPVKPDSPSSNDTAAPAKPASDGTATPSAPASGEIASPPKTASTEAVPPAQKFRVDNGKLTAGGDEITLSTDTPLPASDKTEDQLLQSKQSYDMDINANDLVDALTEKRITERQFIEQANARFIQQNFHLTEEQYQKFVQEKPEFKYDTSDGKQRMDDKLAIEAALQGYGRYTLHVPAETYAEIVQWRKDQRSLSEVVEPLGSSDLQFHNPFRDVPPRQVVAYERIAEGRPGDRIQYGSEQMDFLQFDTKTGKPILFEEGRGNNFCRVGERVTADELNAGYEEVLLNDGERVLMNKAHTKVYEKTTATADGDFLLYQDPQYVIAGAREAAPAQQLPLDFTPFPAPVERPVQPEIVDPSLSPFERGQARTGAEVVLNGETFNIARFDIATGKPILFKENRGDGFVQQMRRATGEDLTTKYDSIVLNGKTYYMDKAHSEVFAAMPTGDGTYIMAQEHQYVIFDEGAHPNALKMRKPQ